MAPHSSTLAWKIPWTEEPGRLQSMGSRRVRHLLSNFTFTFHFHALEKDMATHSSVLAWRVPGTGEPGGLPSIDTTEVTQQQQLLYLVYPLSRVLLAKSSQYIGHHTIFFPQSLPVFWLEVSVLFIRMPSTCEYSYHDMCDIAFSFCFLSESQYGADLPWP